MRKPFYLFIFLLHLWVDFQAASLRALSRRYRSGKPAQHCDLIDYLMAWNTNLNWLDVVQSIVMLDFSLN